MEHVYYFPLFYYRDAVICLTEDMSVILYLVESTGILTELDRVKLSCKLTGKKGSITWVGSTLAIITGWLYSAVIETLFS